VITLTPSATKTIERILASPEIPDGAGVRISPADPGTDGASEGQLALRVAEEPDAGDQVIEEQGARVFVQETAAQYLDQMSLDADIVDEEVRFRLGGPSDTPL